MNVGLNRNVNRRTLLKGAGAAAGMASAGTFLSVLPAQGADPFTIRMQLGWLGIQRNSGRGMADKLGYFAEEGLELEIVPVAPTLMVLLRWHQVRTILRQFIFTFIDVGTLSRLADQMCGCRVSTASLHLLLANRKANRRTKRT